MAHALPHVTVDVCARCNNGWMSVLEAEAKAILEPFFATKRPIRLTTDNLSTLAAWAVKSWMAYALTRSTQQNPFTEADYRALADRHVPPGRSAIWLLHSTDPGSHVSLGLESTLVTERDTVGPLDAADNAGIGFLAADTLVMYMVIGPPFADAAQAELALAPRTLSQTSGVRQVWPQQRAQFFPLEPAPQGLVARLIRWPEELFDVIGLPAEGLTDEDVRHVQAQFIAGADPAELRTRWLPQSDGGPPPVSQPRQQ